MFLKLPHEETWEDAYDVYGISLTDASLSRLMTPAPNKAAIENKSRLQHGKRVVRDVRYTLKDEREVSLEMHLTAPTRASFWSRYRSFCRKYLDSGFIDMYHRDIHETLPTQDSPTDTVFRMTYLDCEQFSEFCQQLGKFSLRLSEPDPTNRGAEDKWKSTESEGSEQAVTRPDIDVPEWRGRVPLSS